MKKELLKTLKSSLDLNISFAPLPKEEYPATEVEYGSITFNGNKIRTIVTKPKLLVAGKLPAVFLVPWLSCGSIEIPNCQESKEKD